MTAPKVWLADGTASPSTLKNVEEWAADNKSQAMIASLLGIPRRELETALSRNKGNNPLRLAWERGAAVVEQRLRDTMFACAMGVQTEKDEEVHPLGADGLPDLNAEKIVMRVRKIYISKGATTTAIFYAKAQFGWKEGESSDKTVSNVVLMLPKPQTRAEFFAMMGVEDTKQIGAADLKEVKALPAPALEAPK